MKDQYRHLFESARLPDERRAEIRTVLSARLAENEKEGTVMCKKSNTFRMLAVTVAVIAAILLVGFTVGGKIVKLLSGGTLISQPGEGIGGLTMEMGFRDDPAEVCDGHIYFTLDGSNLDITDQCSEETYFQYETEENGARQVVLVGGTPENLGFALYVWLDDGSKASTYDMPSSETPPWLKAAEAEFNS